jgi:isopentenyl-diphosphate delta-isomerase
MLHRAFSVFLFSEKGELLLQQRAAGKRLWGGYWSNTCCSHPRRGESLAIATSRRLLDELNIEATLEYVYHFCYEAAFGSRGSENELCHVFLGRAPGKVQPNDSEIAALRYLAPADLEVEFRERPERYTPWFRQEWRELTTTYRERLERYCRVA